MGQQNIYAQLGTVGTLSSPGSCSAAANSGGGAAWQNPGNVTAPGPPASAQVGASGPSQTLQFTGFGLKVPSLASVTGVQAGLVRSASSAGVVVDNAVALVKAGVSTGFNHASGLAWPVAPAAASYGGPADLWSVALTPADVNASNFGFSVAANLPANVGAYVWGVPGIVVYWTLQLLGLPVALVDDLPAGAGVSAWSSGASVMAPVPLQPGLTTPWAITGWSVSFHGVLLQQGGAPSYGRLGDLYAGLVPGGRPTLQAGVPWVTPLQSLPPDLSMVSRVRDGATDPPFPFQTAASPAAVVPTAFSTALSSPVQLQPGDAASFGLWLAPALVQNAQTAIAGASYTVTYDDGVPPR